MLLRSGIAGLAPVATAVVSTARSGVISRITFEASLALRMVAGTSILPLGVLLSSTGRVGNFRFDRETLQGPRRSREESGGGEGRAGDWTCPKCGMLNFRFRHMCKQCSGPRAEGEDDMPAFDSAREFGGRGEGGGRGGGGGGRGSGDWICGNEQCGAHNFARRGVCLDCGSPRPSDAAVVADWNCGNCGHMNFARRMECQQCGSGKDGSPGTGGGGDFGGGGYGGDNYGGDDMVMQRGGRGRGGRGRGRGGGFGGRGGGFGDGGYGGGGFGRGGGRGRGGGMMRGGRGGGGDEPFYAQRSGDWECVSCGTTNFAFRQECKQCGRAKPYDEGY